MVIRFDDCTIDRAQQKISIGEHSYDFNHANGPIVYRRPGSSVAFETIAHMLLNGHTTRKKLFDLIYGHDDRGGPINGYHIFDVHFSNWRHIFEALGVQLRRETLSGEQKLSLARRG